MKYFECEIKATADVIEENANFRLKDFDYDSSVCALNEYVHKNIKSGVEFFMFEETGSTIKAVFFYFEEKMSYRDAYASLTDILEEAASVCLSAEPEEITVLQFVADLMEARRRALVHPRNYTNVTNEFVYLEKTNLENDRNFVFEERLAPAADRDGESLYDESLRQELARIESYEPSCQLIGNLTHYVISAKSREAALDMAEVLLQKMIKSGRANSRRIDCVFEMGPDVFRRADLENMILGAYNCTVFIDLTEQFGKDPTSYAGTCAYLEKLVRKYRNDTLFIFYYNQNHPGFAFKLLPGLQKYISLVKIREGRASKDKAVAYLEELIGASEYGEFAGQAAEFLAESKKKTYLQSDVLEAFEKFEPWCLNRNFGGSYQFGSETEFTLERDKEDMPASEMLEKLIGLESVKAQIHKILVADIYEHAREEKSEDNYERSSRHMIFAGNPGSAKTTVARLFAGLAKDKEVLKSGIFVERGGNDYNSGGPELVRRDFEAASGGVLFIDEAYALTASGAVTALIQEMENRRDDVIVILAGYNDGMSHFLKLNEGLKSRIPFWVDFPDYSTNELLDILELMATERGFKLADDVRDTARVIFDKARLMDDFGNGRYVRNLFEKAVLNQSERLMKTYEKTEKTPDDQLFLLTGEDFEASQEEKESCRKCGEAQAELEEMIGLEAAKKTIRKAVASFKIRKFYSDNGICQERPAMHMVFTGNPGTAKTTVARLVAEILRDEKILPSGHFVEVGRAELVGQFVGHTAPLVKQRFNEAQGGVLFIDEAYSLCDSSCGIGGSYGKEAIDTIVQEMENHREDVIVIFAGYPKEMKEFLEKNPGMSSRIAFHVEFEDYTDDELCQIAELMLKKKSMKISDQAMEKLRRNFQIAAKHPDFGNGRYVRKLLEEAQMNLAERMLSCDESAYDLDLLTTLEACDIEDVGSPEDELSAKKAVIGFKLI